MRYVLLLLIPAMIGSAVAPCVAQDAAKTKIAQAEKIRQYVQPYIDNDVLNAVSIGVVRINKDLGQQQWIGHFGKLSDQQATPPTDQTIYEIGSVSKVFTGVLLADAVQSNQVKLVQPIGTLRKVITEKNPKVGKTVQLVHLSTHNSGLPRMPDNLNPANPSDPYTDYDRTLLTDFMTRVRPERAPDVKYEYSNLAAGLLGDLLAEKSGLSYDELLKSKIAGPLKMDDTTITLSAEQESRVAPPHNEGLGAESPWNFQALAGAGGIRSTVPDMLRFVRATLDPPNTELGKAMELAWKQHRPARDGGFAMGLGWHFAGDGSTRWHNGQTGGYHSMLLVNRDLKVGVVALSNTATMQVDVIGQSIIQILAGADVQPPKFPETKEVDIKTMERLVGKYRLFPNFVLDVTLNKKHLMVQATGQPALQVYPESDTKWNYKVVPAEITFELPEEGSASALTLHQNGRDMRGPRVK